MKKFLVLVLLVVFGMSLNAQIIEFKDENFKRMLVNTNSSKFIAYNSSGSKIKVDTNNDKEIQVSEALVVTKLRLEQNSGITDLGGIEYFANLLELDFVYNKVKFLDISKNTKLEILNAEGGELTDVNLSKNLELVAARLERNKLNSLDVSNNTKLKSLSFSSEVMTGIDLSKNISLTSLICEGESLKALDLSKNLLLFSLKLKNTGVKVIDFSGVPNLKQLEVSSKVLTHFDVSKAKMLERLTMSGENIKTIDLSSNVLLKYISCGNTSVSHLDLSKNIELTQISCTDGVIETLDLPNSSKLTSISCGNNQIKNLDLSKKSNLSNLSCYNNKLTELDLSSNSRLSQLSCGNNELTAIDVSKNLFLNELSIRYTNITQIDLTQNTSLSKISLDKTKIESLDLSNCKKLSSVRISDNEFLKYLNIRNGEVSTYFGYIYRVDNLKTICADDDEVIGIQNQLDARGYHNVVLNLFCGSKLPAESSVLQLDNTNCQSDDVALPLDLNYSIATDTLIGFIIPDKKGNYQVSVPNGDYVIKPILDNAENYEVSQSSYAVSFPLDQSPAIQEFCIKPNRDKVITDENFLYYLTKTNIAELYSEPGKLNIIDKNQDGLIQKNEADDVKRIDLSRGRDDIGSVGIDNFYYIPNELNSRLEFNSYDSSKIYSEQEIQNLVNTGEIVLYHNSVKSESFRLIRDFDGLNLFGNLEELIICFAVPNDFLFKNLPKLKSVKNVRFKNEYLDSSVNTFYFTSPNFYEVSYNTPFWGGNNFYYSNVINSISFENCPNIEFLDFNVEGGYKHYNNLIISTGLNEAHSITELDVSQLLKLKEIDCTKSNIKSLDLSKNTSLIDVDCSDGSLEKLFIKDGRSYPINFETNPQFKFLCVDNDELDEMTSLVFEYGYDNVSINSYCSFDLGGDFEYVQGVNNYCEDENVRIPNLKYEINDGVEKGIVFSNQKGEYQVQAKTGKITITPLLERHENYSITPSEVTIDLVEGSGPKTQDFCVTPKSEVSDLEIVFEPIGTPARPGFDAIYKIVYQNKGTMTQSGTVELTYFDDVLDYISSNPSLSGFGNYKLNWDFKDLKPFEKRTIEVTFNVNSPQETPVVNNGDILNFIASINPSDIDETPNDNTHTLRNTVVGSYDPNDKACLEGKELLPDMIGEYVHYRIRFENTGTFPAENIVVVDEIDESKFDLSTLVILDSSHEDKLETKITGNKVEFIFEGIQLPFDDTTNDGYILFKIKTLSTLKLGGSFSNQASIYFDFNFPIITNNETTTIVEEHLGVADFEFNNELILYPNPVQDRLSIEPKNGTVIQLIDIYNLQGQLVLSIPQVSQTSFDVSNLSKGVYIVNVITDKGVATTKLVKE